MHRACWSCHFVPIFHVHDQASPVILKSQLSKLALQIHRNSMSYQALYPSCSTTVRQYNHYPTSYVDRFIMVTPSDFGFGSPLTSSSAPLASTRTPRHLCLHPDPVSIPPPRARPFISLGLLCRHPPHLLHVLRSHLNPKTSPVSAFQTMIRSRVLSS